MRSSARHDFGLMAGRRAPGRRRMALGLAIAAAAALSAVSAAFACSPRCCFATIAQASGGPSSRVTVQGTAFGNQSAVIRWATPDGDILARPTGSNWTATVTIPDAAPGFYSIVVQGTDPSTNVVTDGVSPTFHVTGTSPSSGPTDEPVTTPTTQTGGGDQATQSPVTLAPVTQVSSAPVPAAAAPDEQQKTPVPSATPAPVSRASQRTPAAVAAPRSGVVPVGAVAATPVAAGLPVPQPLAATPEGASAPSPSSAGAIPQPWSAKRTAPATGLLEAGARRDGPLKAGVVVLGLGLVALFAGVVTLGVRRRPAVHPGQDG